MKTRYILTVLLGLFFLPAKAQKVYKVRYESQADVKVCIVKYESRCDLKVYLVDYESQASKDGLWYFVQYESQADKKIYFAVSVTNLQATYYADKDIFGYLKGYTPVEKIADSIFIYDLTGRQEDLKKIKALVIG